MPRFGLHGAPASYLHPGQLPYGPGLGVAPTFSFSVGGVSLTAPQLPTEVRQLQSRVADLAKLPVSAATLRSALGRARGIADTAAAAMGGDVLNAIAGAAAMVPPPYGAALAMAVSIGGPLISGLFSGSSEVPKPEVGGRKVEDIASAVLATANDGVLAGKIVSGEIQADPLLKQSVIGDATIIVAATLDMLADGKTVNQADVLLRAGKRSNGTRNLPPSSFRAVAYFCAYADFATISTMGGTSRNLAREIGKILAWAAPRVQIREMFWYWYLYRCSLAGYTYTWGSNRYGRLDGQDANWKWHGVTYPVPGLASFHPEFYGRGWGGTQRLAGKDENVSPDVWAGLVRSRVAPVPVPDPNTGLWSYQPLDETILAEEIAKYDPPGFRPGMQKIADVPLSGMDRDEWVVRFPDRTHELSVFPEGYAEAAKLCKAFVAADKKITGDGAGTTAGYVGHLERGLAEMNRPATITIVAGGRLAELAAESRAKRARKSLPARPGPTTRDKPPERPADPETQTEATQAGLGGGAGLLLLGGLVFALSKMASPRSNPRRRVRRIRTRTRTRRR